MKNLNPGNKFFAILLVISFGTTVLAVPVISGIEKGFNALSVFNYFEARTIFTRYLEKFPCVSNFGLAVISSRNDNPFFNLDSAYMQINLSALSFQTTGKTESKKKVELNITAATIDSLQRLIERKAYEAAVSAGNISSLTKYIQTYTASLQMELASRMRDSLAFELVVKENSAEGYQRFVEEYPKSHLQADAQTRYERALFNESISDQSIDSYARFVEAYPKSPHALEAMNAVYYLSTGNSTDPRVYYKFIQDYPGNSFVSDAWQRIYDLSMPSVDANSITTFRQMYPDYPEPELLEQEYRMSLNVLLPFNENGKWGFADSLGRTIIQPTYDLVGKFCDGLCVISKDGKMGYLSKEGVEIIPPFYDDAEDFQNKLAIVTLGDKSGVVDRSGKMVVPLVYEEIGDYSEGLAAAFDGNMFGYINRNGTTVIPFRFESAGEFKEGTAVCNTGGFYGIIDSKGEEIVPFEYESAEGFDQGIAQVEKKDRFGLIQRNGVVLVAPVFDELGSFHSGRAVAVIEEALGFIDTSGVQIIPMQFDAVRDFQVRCRFLGPWAAVRKGAGFGIIDRAGETVVPYKYSDLGVPSDSLVAFRSKNIWGYLQLPSGSVVIKPTFSIAGEFKHNTAIVRTPKKTGVIDAHGNWKIPPSFDHIERVADSLFVVVSKQLFGLFNSDGKELIPAGYNSFRDTSNGFLEFKLDNKTFWYDLKNNRVLEHTE